MNQKSISSPERVAKELLEMFGINRAPIDVRDIAERIEIIVVEDELADGASGYLIREPARTVIALEQRESDFRKRFTIAHEIGHFVMHPGRPLVVEADVKINKRSKAKEYASEKEEREANQFAASLLMPRELVGKYFDRAMGSENAARTLADKFEVSLVAMQFRLTNLGLLMPVS